MRLIDADALIKDILDLRDCYNGFSDTYDKACIIGVIDEQPTIEPKKGKWMKEDSIYETVTCSVCHGVRRDNRVNHVKFCNCCGADMRGSQA